MIGKKGGDNGKKRNENNLMLTLLVLPAELAFKTGQWWTIKEGPKLYFNGELLTFPKVSRTFNPALHESLDYSDWAQRKSIAV